MLTFTEYQGFYGVEDMGPFSLELCLWRFDALHAPLNIEK
jgi:hypothetical protein